MQAMERLAQEMKKRPAELAKIKEEGDRKVVGYTPGGYMPEELVYASGAIPLCLIRGGDPEPLVESLRYLPRFQDTFCRAQVGYLMLGEEPLYQLPDILINPITDYNIRAIGECWAFCTDLDVFFWGVPQIKDELGINTFTINLNRLKEKLEDFTGNKITEEKLSDEIESYNKMRALLKDISMMRKSAKFPISSQDFVRLNHASYILDKLVVIDILEALLDELKTADAVNRSDKRILFTGGTIAMGDNRIFDILDEYKGDIVFEEFAEGVRPYMNNVALNGDPMAALTEALYTKRYPPAWFRPFDEFQNHLFDLIEEWKIDGVLWYQLLYRDGYDMQSFLFEKALQEEKDMPMIKIETDYDTSEKGQIRTRLDTFVSIMHGG